MTIITLILILLSIALIIAVLKSKGKVKKILLSIFIIIILIPISLIFLIKPAQQGKILPNWGKLSLLFAPPKDLWDPLAIEKINKSKKEYHFFVTHKYVGNYDIVIIFTDKDIDVWKITKDDLNLSVHFYEKGKLLFSKETSFVGALSGLKGKGLTYIRYSLPEDLAIDKRLNVKIQINGSIDEFINKFGEAELLIKKGSDL